MIAILAVFFLAFCVVHMKRKDANLPLDNAQIYTCTNPQYDTSIVNAVVNEDVAPNMANVAAADIYAATPAVDEDPYSNFAGWNSNEDAGLYSRVVIDRYATIMEDYGDQDDGSQLSPIKNAFARNLAHALTIDPPAFTRLLAEAGAARLRVTHGSNAPVGPSDVLCAAIGAVSDHCGNGESDATLVRQCIEPALAKGKEIFQMQVAAGTLPNDALTPADIAAIHFYTLPTELYSAVNRALRRL